jgi:hypothetical protein
MFIELPLQIIEYFLTGMAKLPFNTRILKHTKRKQSPFRPANLFADSFNMSYLKDFIKSDSMDYGVPVIVAIFSILKEYWK